MKVGIVGPSRLPYCAGLLEGEGSFGLHSTGVVIQCSMTDKEPLEILALCLGGHITGPYGIDSKNKPIWKWSLSYREKAIKVCNRLLPFMSPRRQKQINRVLEYDQKNPKKVVGPAKHGTIGMYSNHLCRCGRCKKSHSSYMRQWRSRRCV